MKVGITELKVGTGAAAHDGDWLKVHYCGALASNGAVFDETTSKGPPFQFQLGAGDVIEGWEHGLVGLRVGGKRRLEIPSELAYGTRGAGDLIPPGADLRFDVELIEIRTPKEHS